MSHDRDCPARYGCCPNDEYGCSIHVEPPCNCAQPKSEAPEQLGTRGEAGDERG